MCISVFVVARFFLRRRPRMVPSLLRERPALREWSMPRLLRSSVRMDSRVYSRSVKRDPSFFLIPGLGILSVRNPEGSRGDGGMRRNTAGYARRPINPDGRRAVRPRSIDPRAESRIGAVFRCERDIFSVFNLSWFNPLHTLVAEKYGRIKRESPYWILRDDGILIYDHLNCMNGIFFDRYLYLEWMLIDLNLRSFFPLIVSLIFISYAYMCELLKIIILRYRRMQILDYFKCQISKKYHYKL